MSLHSLTDKTVKKITASMGGRLEEKDVAALSEIIHEALTAAVNESAKTYSNRAVVCCGPEADLAHKIAEDMERARYALIANLTSMR